MVGRSSKYERLWDREMAAAGRAQTREERIAHLEQALQYAQLAQSAVARPAGNVR